MEEPVCPVCVVFEPQAWRKSLCRNCFKTFEQHSMDGSEPPDDVTEISKIEEISQKQTPPTSPPLSPHQSSSLSIVSSLAPSLPTTNSTLSSASTTLTSVTTTTTTAKITASQTIPSFSTTTTTSATSTTLTSSKTSSPSLKVTETAVKSTEDTKNKPGKPSDTSTSPSKTCGDISTSPSKTSGDISTSPSKTSGDISTSPSKTSGDISTSPSKTSGDISTSQSKTSGNISTSPSKTSGEKKVSLVSAIAGKIEQPKRGVTSVNGVSGKSKSTNEKKTSTAVLLGKTTTGTKDSIPVPSTSPSLSNTSDTSARSTKADSKRLLGAVGGSGAGTKFDVIRGQKTTDGKGKNIEVNANIAAGPKSKTGDARKVGKEANQSEIIDTAVSSSTTATSVSTTTVTTASDSAAVTTTSTASGRKVTGAEKIFQQRTSISNSETSSTPKAAQTSTETSNKIVGKLKSSDNSGTTGLSTSGALVGKLASAASLVPATKLTSKGKQDAPSTQTPSKTSPTAKYDTTDSAKKQYKLNAGVNESPPSVEHLDIEEKEKSLLLSTELAKNEKPVKKEVPSKERDSKDDVTLLELENLRKELAVKDDELKILKQRLGVMETECRPGKQQADERKWTKQAHGGQKEELEKTLDDLRKQVSAMEKQCSRLEVDNQALLEKLRAQEEEAKQVAAGCRNQEENGPESEVSGLQGSLKSSELEVENLREENSELRQELCDLRREMDEMYDSFRENEVDEYREIQRELELTAKNCRVLQFKLRKAERRNEQVESDRQHYEEKLRSLQQQFESGDARSHIEALECELRTAKEVSVRLHDELDMMEDRRNKALEENRHLTELLEQTDKKQFRMEMEIDKLRDQIADLKQQLRDRSPARKEGTPDRKPPVGRQGSQEYDCAQLMRDLCDSVERETDLKEQLKFVEEESKMMRRKLAEMEDENEALRVQLQKLSLKASRWKEESEARGQLPIRKQAQAEVRGQDQERERLDSSDDEMSVVTLKLQMAMVEQELMTSQRAKAEAEQEAEKYQAEVTSMKDRLKEYETLVAMKREQEAPPPPDAYYEEKVRDLTQQADELRWRIIEKDRELERLSVTSVHVRHTHQSHHGHLERSESVKGRLKKSKSLDSDPVMEDLRRQLESALRDVTSVRHQMTELHEATEKEKASLRQQIQELMRQSEKQVEFKDPTNTTPLLLFDPLPVPVVRADDAAVENIELRDKVRKGEEEARTLREQVRVLTENLHALSRAHSPRLSSSASTSPLSPSLPLLSSVNFADSSSNVGISKTIASIPASSPFFISASTCSSSIPHTPDLASDEHAPQRQSEEEVRVLAAKMAELLEDNLRLRALLSKSSGQGAGSVEEKEGEAKGIAARLEKHKVTVGDNESREALMDKILDMEEEMNDLLLVLKRREQDALNKSQELASLRSELQDVQDRARKMELELLKDLDMLHDKNTVLSNLLEIVQERANAAEDELERCVQESSSPSTRSASAVSAISALSDASCGSDEVFLTPPIGGCDKGQIIHRDWEAKLKNRIDSLERLLAEERQKVTMVEKKLRMANPETLAPSISDDVKLRLREKELLQEELLENQRHLRIATDQILGQRERLHALEEEHHRLKLDYGKLCQELEKRDEPDSDQTAEDSDKTPENSMEPEDTIIDVRATDLLGSPTSPSSPSPSSDKNVKDKNKIRDKTKSEEAITMTTDSVEALQRELACYKLKAEQLEYKVEEISDIWRSKSAATEREKHALEAELREKSQEMSRVLLSLEQTRRELQDKEEILSRSKAQTDMQKEELRRLEAVEKELQELVTQSSASELAVRELRDAVSTRDERLKEKDDIIHYLNACIDERQMELTQLQQRVTEMASRLNEKAEQVLRQTMTSLVSSGKETELGETDLEKENARLRETTRALRVELDQGDVTRKDAEKMRRTLQDAALCWEKEKAALQASLIVTEEKLRLYETLPTMTTSEAIESLKSDSLKYFAEKEALGAQVAALRQELTTCQRNAREMTSRLQSELTSKLRQLKEEVDVNTRQQSEIERLKVQAERAYRLQQEDRVLRAEHQAIKVRYDTRLEKMTREYSKMLVEMEQLQKEKQLDKEMVASVQKGISLIRDAHSQDQMRWEEEKARLERQLREFQETRVLVEEMQLHTADLREKIAEQERARADHVNRFATDRGSWDMERAKLHGKINQMEEEQARLKRDGAVTLNVETAWAQERAQQQTLLAQAHDLALDLQKQLVSRDQEASRARRQLVEQFESERQTWDRERRENDRKLSELEGHLKRQSALLHHVTEVQEQTEREAQQARRERAELLRHLAETRQQQSRDAKFMDDILAGLVRLRELGSILLSNEKQTTDVNPQLTSNPLSTVQTSPSFTSQTLDKDIVNYIKEALMQISTAADDLDRYGNHGNGRIRRSFSTCDLEFVREELADLRREGDDVFISPNVVLTTITDLRDKSQPPPRTSLEGGAPASDITLPVILHPFSVTYDKKPSYASGTHSAQTSRSTSPDVQCTRTPSFSLKFTKLPELSKDFRKSSTPDSKMFQVQTIPHKNTAGHKNLSQLENQTQILKDHGIHSTTTSPSSTTTVTEGTSTTPTDLNGESKGVSPSQNEARAIRPRTLIKSLSVDMPSVWLPSPSATPTTRSFSACTTPTQPPSVSDLRPGCEASPKHTTTSGKRRDSGLSPRTARKKFFEEQPSGQIGFLSWPERGRQGGQVHALPTPGVDPGEVRRVAEEEHDWLLSRVTDPSPSNPASLRTSTSYDEKMHHRVLNQPGAAVPISSPVFEKTTPSNVNFAQPKLLGEGSSTISQGKAAKEKRRLWKKSSSLESDVGTCIARAGMHTLVPPAVPSAFSPADLLATVKGKLAPVFHRRDGCDTHRQQAVPRPRPPSPLFTPTDVPDIPLRPPISTTVASFTTTTTALNTSSTKEAESVITAGSASTTAPLTSTATTALITSTSKEAGPVVSDSTSNYMRQTSLPAEYSGSSSAQNRGRESRRPETRAISHGDSRDSKWRSHSADGRHTPALIIHTDVIMPAQVWQFSETAV